MPATARAISRPLTRRGGNDEFRKQKETKSTTDRGGERHLMAAPAPKPLQPRLTRQSGQDQQREYSKIVVKTQGAIKAANTPPSTPPSDISR